MRNSLKYGLRKMWMSICTIEYTTDGVGDDVLLQLGYDVIVHAN